MIRVYICVVNISYRDIHSYIYIDGRLNTCILNINLLLDIQRDKAVRVSNMAVLKS